eukprot:NODE_214_length_12495_cov_0.543078.p7 type:complete len:121 gc:universal NODE_214_length_12495_cov_0.543078:10153-9791(-)
MLTLSDVSALFDGIIALYPSMISHLSPSSEIVQSPIFENAVVKVLDNEEHKLSYEEKLVLKPFLLRDDVVEVVEVEELKFADGLIEQKIKRFKTTNYIDLSFIFATSTWWSAYLAKQSLY